MGKELVITKKINAILKTKSLTVYRVSKLMGVSDSALYGMIKGDTPFSPDFKEKIIPILEEVSPEEFEGWILVDKYPKNILKLALEVKQEIKPEASKLILTIKIDSLLQDKGLSRTALSGIIGYSQGKLNQMIKGDEPISPLVISKIAPVLDVSEEDITSWTVADKHSVDSLRVALECK